MAMKVYNLEKKIHKKYFGEKYRGSEVLKNLGEVSPKNYRSFVKLSKRAKRRENITNVKKNISKGLEIMVFRYAA